jgi:hypothetical protein
VVKLYDGRIDAIQFSKRLVDKRELSTLWLRLESKDLQFIQTWFNLDYGRFLTSYLSYVPLF